GDFHHDPRGTPPQAFHSLSPPDGYLLLDTPIKNLIIQPLVKEAAFSALFYPFLKSYRLGIMQNTYLPTQKEINRKWWIVDATDMVVGRLTSQVAAVLRGKHKVNFTPHVENG